VTGGSAIRRIAVGVDGSDASEVVLRWVAALAHDVGATVVVVHGADLVERYEARASSEDSFEQALRRRIERDWLAALRERGVLHEVVVRPEPAVDLLLGIAPDVDLVVVGRRVAAGPPGMELGSTSRQLVSRAPVPVVVIPTGG
jgi:nucleotide-binding universal stress UspA family protein